ncbi:LOW QUALITY PROTEIN: coilin [Onychostoma macrolepis]|uniref:LOW QUALITY PROTEIN: coilin n=1 Tax=Onychostoma macrolepis TaxID=369639 RepID=UPI00272DA88F|nr:LOW QUALITY PROTEIN: coilin [Onychostoma macrolepis]
MATSLNCVRVRLYFDYPPPATPECRMCWLLVDLNKCRVVADLSSIIKEKFGYSRRTILDLFIEDCYLPSTESIYIVRDNDGIRVKASSAVYINGADVYQNPEAQNSKAKKRGREDEMQISEGISKKKKHEDVQINGLAPAEGAKKKKKKKKEVKESATKPAAPQKNTETPSSTKNNRKSISAVPTSDKTTRKKTRQPTSSSSDSSEGESHNKAPPPKPKPKPKQNGAAKKPRNESTSSSDDTERSKNNASVQPLPVTPKLSSTTSKLPLQTPQRRESTDSSSSSPSLSQARTTAKKSQVSAQPSSATVQSVSSSVPKKPQDKPESSDSEASEIELVIKKPNLQGMGLKIAGLSPGVSEAAGRDRGNTRGQERGRGRGANRGSGRGGFGRAKGTPWKQDFHYNYENGERQKQNDSLTNESFILQNPPETAPKRDYAALPLLAAPPAVGQKIAFKLLELTENYTPEVSDYKEGKIIAFNPQTKVMELELISQTQAPAEPGKFDLVYQNPDGSERVEYAVTHGSQLTERWDSLLEPRLIVENVG